MKNIYLSLFCFFFISVQVHAQWEETVNKPIETFEKFWQLFNNSYASFEEKNINWDSIGQAYRPSINARTNNKVLFTTFCDMLKPLKDAHVNLIVEKADTVFDAERPSRLIEDLQPIREKVRISFNEMVKATLAEHGIQEVKSLGKDWNSIPLFWYGNNGKIGYLRVGRCFSTLLIKNGLGINRKLNKIFKSFEGLSSIIIDIRLNPGGTDGFSKKVAGKLTKKQVISYYKQTRENGKFGQLHTHYIKPAGKYPFLKPVYLLTNEKSISAADVMALMMAELENVTIIGENSNGSYSDIYAKKLPNKWVVTLSNQRYLTTTNKNHEGTGTPVDIEIKNMLENYQNKKDLILSKAFELGHK